MPPVSLGLSPTWKPVVDQHLSLTITSFQILHSSVKSRYLESSSPRAYFLLFLPLLPAKAGNEHRNRSGTEVLGWKEPRLFGHHRMFLVCLVVYLIKLLDYLASSSLRLNLNFYNLNQFRFPRLLDFTHQLVQNINSRHNEEDFIHPLAFPAPDWCLCSSHLKR